MWQVVKTIKGFFGLYNDFLVLVVYREPSVMTCSNSLHSMFSKVLRYGHLEKKISLIIGAKTCIWGMF